MREDDRLASLAYLFVILASIKLRVRFYRKYGVQSLDKASAKT